MNGINSSTELSDPADQPIEYRRRIRDYYLALGYERPYQFAHYKDVPFQRLARPLHASKVALVTTAAPLKPGAGDQGPGAPYNGAAKFYSVYEFDMHSSPDLRISHVAYDREHTHARDSNSWLPVTQLQAAVADGIVGELTDTGFGLPTNRSRRITAEKDCPDLLERLTGQGADAVVLVPNCPVCHQSVSLAARHIEAAGIPTVIMGCAKDIVEYVGVPRVLFSDFPLGNAAGRPDDVASQRETLRMALDLLSSATSARTTVQSSQVFSADPGWKRDYSNASLLTEQEIARRRKEFDQQKQAAAAVRREK